MEPAQTPDDPKEAPVNQPVDEAVDTPAPAAPRKRRRLLRAGLWSCGCMGLLLIALVIVALLLIGREMSVPAWMHSRLEARLSTMVPGAEVRFEGINFEVSSGLKPRVLLQGVEIDGKDGRPILALGELETGLAARPLLDGKMRLGKLRVSGAELFVRRRADGTFDLAFGASLPEVEQAASPAELIANLDRLMQSDELRHLRDVTAEAMILRFEDARVGRAWTVDGGRISLTREGDDLRIRGDMALLGGHQYVTTVETNFESKIGETAARFGMSFEDMPGPDIAVQSAAVAWLEAVQAPISGALRGSVTPAGDLGPISGTLQIAEGVIQPTAETKPVPFRSARSYFTFDPVSQSLSFDELTVDSNWVSLKAEGKAVLQGLEAGIPEAFQGQFTLTDLTAAPEGLVPEPVSVDRAAMSFRLTLDPFELHMGELTLEAEGQTLVANGRARAAEDGWALSVSAQAASLDPKAVLRLWPEEFRVKNRKWVAENIYHADIRNGHFAYRKMPGQEHDIFASFEFQDANVRYSRHLPPIEAGKGHGVLEGKRFAVTGDGGYITPPKGGRIDITGTTFVIPDITIKPAPAEVNLVAHSNLTAALSLLNLPPLSVLDKAGRDLDLATGQVAATGQLRMPLKKKLPPEMVRYEIEALLAGMESTTLVPEKTLRADRLELSVDNDRLVIIGPGTVDGVPFDAVYESGLSKEERGKAQVYGTVDITPEALEALNITLPKGTLRGAGEGRMTLVLEKDQPPMFELTSDLAGLGLSVPPLGWSLPQSREGEFSIRGALSKPVRVDALSLRAPGLSAAGRLVLAADGGLQSARFDRVQAGGWLDAPVILTGRGKGRPPAVNLPGGTVDLSRRPPSANGGSTAGGSTPLEVKLDRLRISDGISLTGLTGRFNAGVGLNGDFTARVNGAAAITGRVASAGSRASYAIRSEDAGGVFKAAGLLKQARDGDMLLRLSPAAQQGHYDGMLQVSNTRVTEVPALASLLHAVSVVGVLEQMAGGGIMFSDVEAKFRLTPEQLLLQKSSAVGASMGISMDGIFNLKSGTMDFQGVLSPVYMFNGIGAILTRKGEGLIGFNYLLKGSAENPRVQVNPLSLFTPGMFREIFRRPPPQVGQ